VGQLLPVRPDRKGQKVRVPCLRQRRLEALSGHRNRGEQCLLSLRRLDEGRAGAFQVLTKRTSQQYFAMAAFGGKADIGRSSLIAARELFWCLSIHIPPF
jgi:hypothetical protein